MCIAIVFAQYLSVNISENVKDLFCDFGVEQVSLMKVNEGVNDLYLSTMRV